ncbi:MAG: ABC transporter ATP-binding protein, partial [Lachnospiraceae bacterium]|nr:ABC transporter ATP-binding protein [Lachnospiraceae bacterium]
SSTPDDMTVLNNVLIGRNTYISPFATPKQSDVNICIEKLRKVGMESYADRKLATLSGGEAQLIYIARALASNPDMIILDEPESGLDFKNQLKILNLIEELSKSGIAIVFNTHYPKHALQIREIFGVIFHLNEIKV